MKKKLHLKQPENAFTKRKELLTRAFSLCLKKRITETVIWSPIMDLEERGHAKAGELWDVALEKRLKHHLV